MLNIPVFITFALIVNPDFILCAIIYTDIRIMQKGLQK